MNDQADPLLNQHQVSKLLNISEAWLEMSRFKRINLSFIKIGKSVR